MTSHVSKGALQRPLGTRLDLQRRRNALCAATVATAEALELRTLLSVSFANLSYADPFPAAGQFGQPSQPAGNVLYSESFTDQSATSNGVLGAADHYWNNTSTLTRTLPASMANGLSQMSVEFWLNVPVGGKIGNMGVLKMPGFELDGTSNWARTPAGVLFMTFSTTRAGEPLVNLRTLQGVIADGQWHQYVATCDGQTGLFYTDGQLVDQAWLGNSADKIGPQVFSGASVSTPTAITYTPFGGSSGFDEIRVSNVVLTPWQVQRNYENCRRYTSTYYVAPSGLSTNSGTRSSPIDLVTAMSRAGSDVKIVLLAGTYNGAGFQVTRSGTGALHNALITGDDGSGQVIIQTTGSGTGPTVSGGAKYVTLRNLTFSSDQQAGLTVSAAGTGNIIDGCRLTSNVDALSIVNSSGTQDPVNGDGAHYVILPCVTLQNSVLAPGAGSTGARYNNSDVIIARNNTFLGGQYGALFTGGSTDVTLLNNIFTGQTSAGAYFSSDSVLEVDGSYSLVSYFGDGNIYNPASGGCVATVVDGTTNNYSTVSDYAKYWYVKQYGSAILGNGDSGAGIGTRSEQRSFRGSPSFVASGSGDYRLAATAPNLVDTGADRVYGRTRMSVSSTVWDGQGGARPQGNAVDAGAFETAGSISKSFTLATSASTSAGVYDSSGKLIRTLWSGVKYPAGSVTAYWNGLDDNNAPVSNGNYTIKLLSNNVQYVWDGATNNSSPLDGPAIQSNFYPIQSMVVIGSTAYYAPGYNEGGYNLYKFDLANIHQTSGRAIPLVSYSDNIINAIASDGSRIYALWENPANPPSIKAYDLNFSEVGLSTTVSSASGASAIAVQPAQQNLLFVAHQGDNKVYIYNKSTFSAYSTASLNGAALGWNTPSSLAVTPDGDLWVTCKNTSSGQWQVLRYTNFAGTPTLAATVTGGLVNPIGIAVSLDGNKTLMVADGETATTVCQQIKGYSPTGASLWQLGQAGGYATNGPAITNDKFILRGMIAPQADGSFWITDLATQNRTMHFSAARSFIEDIQYARSYCAAGDQNNATRVFQNFVEYQIDYSKAYTENQGWTPIRNWNYIGTRNMLPVSNFGGFVGLSVVSTLSNGRTYALVGNEAITGNDADRGSMTILELTASGLRSTGYQTPQWSGYWMDKDGSLINTTLINNNTAVRYNRLALTGFSAAGNPQYAASATVLGTAPWSQSWDNQSPAPGGLPYYAPAFLQLDNGLLVNYNPGVHAAGMHLGAVSTATNQWQWQTMPAGPFNGKGNFDTDGWYGGNRVMASGHNVIAGYNGEGWRNDGQAGQFIHYYDDGLFIGQFGTPSLGAGVTWPRLYGFAGNAFSPFLTASGGSLYLYANDESGRSLQRWHATGMDTIQETSASVTLGDVAAPSGLSATAVSTSQINLTWVDNSSNETGFKLDRATDANFTVGLTTVTLAANATSYSSSGLSSGMTYYFRVRATKDGSDSPNSATAIATTQAGAMTTYEAESGTLGGAAGIYADSNASGGQKVSMGNGATDSLTITNVNGYGGGAFTLVIRYATSGANPVKNLLVNGSVVVALTYPDTGSWSNFSTITTSITLNAGTANTIGVTDLSDRYGLHLDKFDVSIPPAPTAPSGLTATAASQTQVNLVWTDNSSDETGFKVDRATDSSFSVGLTTVTLGANVTTYSSTGLAANTAYYYRVRATNAGADSGNSNTAGPVMPLLQINGDQGFAGQNDQIRVARDLADPSLLDVFLNSVTPNYSVSFGALNMIVINGLGGDDTLTLDLANGPVIPAGGISYDGGTQTGGDSLIIAGSSGNDAVTFASGQATIGSGVVTLTSVENRSFKGGAGNDSLALGAGSYTFASDLGLDTTHLSLSLADGAQVAFSGAQHLGGLTLYGNSKVTLADGGQSTLVVQSLNIGATSSLDVADNAVIVDYTGSSPFAAVYSLVASSAGNHWAGNGIVSHTAAGGGSQYALGVVDNSVANLASFGGQTVDGTSVLVRFTYSGDANLDGQVDLTDLSILAGSWQMAGRQWSQGDVDYSGLVDLTDLALLASNWQKVLPAPVAAPLVSLTSESASVAEPVDDAPAANDVVMTDPAPAQTTSSPVMATASSGTVEASEVAVEASVESSPVAEPIAAATKAIARIRTNPGPVTRKHPVPALTKTAPRSAGFFSNRPLPVASVLAAWPGTSRARQELLGSDRLGLDYRSDILVRIG